MKRKLLIVLPVAFSIGAVTSCKNETQTTEVFVSSITASTDKALYKVGEKITKDDIKVTLNYSDKKTKETTDWKVDGVTFPYTFSLDDEYNAKKVFKIESNNCITSLAVGVTKDKFVSSITATTSPMIYRVGGVINKNDIKVKLIYNDKSEVETTNWTSKVTFPYTFTEEDQAKGQKNI